MDTAIMAPDPPINNIERQSLHFNKVQTPANSPATFSDGCVAVLSYTLPHVGTHQFHSLRTTSQVVCTCTCLKLNAARVKRAGPFPCQPAVQNAECGSSHPALISSKTGAFQAVSRLIGSFVRPVRHINWIQTGCRQLFICLAHQRLRT